MLLVTVLFSCKEQEEELQNLRQQAKVDSIRIRDENMGIEAKKRELKTIERKLADERGTLDRAITRLKEGRI